MEKEDQERSFEVWEESEKRRCQEFKKEPLTRSFLRKFFSSPVFSKALNIMANRAFKERAEGGFIVYKRVGKDSFELVERWGTGELADYPELWSLQRFLDFHVFANDDLDELDRLGIDNKRFVRVGLCHFHPRGGHNWFSSPDIKGYEDFVFKPGDYFLVTPSQELFELLGTVPYSGDYVELFGISLPHGAPTSNLYQRGFFRSAEEQEQVFKQCGFRVVRVKIPLEGGRVQIDSQKILELSTLGG